MGLPSSVCDTNQRYRLHVSGWCTIQSVRTVQSLHQQFHITAACRLRSYGTRSNTPVKITVTSTRVTTFETHKPGKASENSVVFIKHTTCFGPCAGSSSGLNLRMRGDHTACVLTPSFLVYDQKHWSMKFFKACICIVASAVWPWLRGAFLCLWRHGVTRDTGHDLDKFTSSLKTFHVKKLKERLKHHKLGKKHTGRHH
jgi:hypothetical protein